MSSGSKRTFLVAAAFCVVAGCRHIPREDWRGESSYRIVRPPAPTPSRSQEAAVDGSRIRYRTEEAEAMLPLKMPEYPSRALQARAGGAKVGVRVVVGADGAVASVEPSAIVMSTPGAYAADFLAAVQAAVRQWRFKPAELHELHLVGDGTGTYWRAARVEPTEAEFTIEFSFTASGQVRGP